MRINQRLSLHIAVVSLLMVGSVRAESPSKKLLHWSQAAFVAGMSADTGSSWGLREGNPLLRSGDGRFGSQGAAIKLGLMAGGLAMQRFTLKRHPESVRSIEISNFATAGALGILAGRNMTIR